MYSINFTVEKKKLCLSLHYNGADSYLFVNGKEIVKFKAKDSAIVATPLCLGNILKDWSENNMRKLDLMDTFMNFVLIMRPILQQMVLKIFHFLTNILCENAQ